MPGPFDRCLEKAKILLPIECDAIDADYYLGFVMMCEFEAIVVFLL